MKKLLRKALIMLLSALVVFNCVACGDNGGGTNTPPEKVDDTKTQIYVSHYNGGVGNSWLTEVKQRFETEYANHEFEPGTGKKGVQIMVRDHKNAGIMGTLSASDNEVFFMQEIPYNDYTTDFVPLTDMVTEWKLPGEGDATVESKLSDKTKGVLTAKDGNYYALPHYSSPLGVVYNVSLFEEKMFYFADESVTNTDGGFIKNANQKKSCGPDGKYGTSDDGLPSSIEEFYKLCDRMTKSSVTPFIWYGGNTDYSTRLAHALWASLSGYNATLANVSFDSGDEEIELITGFTGNTPTTTKERINSTNGYKIIQQASKYYALDFVQKIFSNEAMYDEDSIGKTVSHTTVQENFLLSYIMSDQPIAMMLEGTYWENEARDSGALATAKKAWENTNGTDFEDEVDGFKYAMMPLPVQATGRVTENNGKPQTGIDLSTSYAFINKHAAKSADKISACKTFIQYCYTDISLQNFTIKSGVTKDVNYNLTDAQYDDLTYFQKSAWDIKTKGSIVQLTSGNNIYTKNSGTFGHQFFWKSKIGNTDYPLPLNAFLDGKTAKEYFLGMSTVADINWWNKLNK